MKYYHATTQDNAIAIMSSGVIKANFGGVFLCTDPHDACKFLLIRGLRDVAVFAVELDEKDVEQSFDHSQAFFQCEAYVYCGDIVLDGTEECNLYHFNV